MPSIITSALPSSALIPSHRQADRAFDVAGEVEAGHEAQDVDQIARAHVANVVAGDHGDDARRLGGLGHRAGGARHPDRHLEQLFQGEIGDVGSRRQQRGAAVGRGCALGLSIGARCDAQQRGSPRTTLRHLVASPERSIGAEAHLVGINDRTPASDRRI
jgi:hypothetical protein